MSDQPRTHGQTYVFDTVRPIWLGKMNGHRGMFVACPDCLAEAPLKVTYTVGAQSITFECGQGHSWVDHELGSSVGPGLFDQYVKTMGQFPSPR